MDIGIIILAISVLCVGAILAGAAGQKIDAPILLVFLLVGMLAGREGPGGISLDASQAMLVWGSAALAAILFEGGLRTEPKVFDLGAAPGLSLALVGTLLTALIVAPFAHFAFGLDWTAALLLGAIVSSTDAAAVFALAATGLKLPERVAAVLEVESGFNDPLAILLVVGLSTSLAIAPMGPGDWAGTLIAKLVIGAAVGIAIGAYTPRLVRGLELPSGLLAILLAALGFMAFGVAETLGGSGFLAIYLCGLVLGRRAPALADRAGSVMDGLAWLAQTGLFLLLGLLVTPSHLASFALPAFGLALALIFLARPVAVLVSLLPFRFRPRDMGFVAWTGLRGATPVYLGLLPAALGVPNGNLYLSAAAVVVLLSLVIQGWTAPVVGRALRLTEESAQDPVDRGETLARLGAVGASIVVGAWFAVILSPDIEQDMMVPETMEELIAGLEAPAMTPAAFPQGFADQPAEVRRPVFVTTVRGVMDQVNQQVMADRDRLTLLDAIFANRGRLTLEEEAEVGTIARRYGLDFALPADLLTRIDVVPPRLATAQAALASGWGSSKQLRANNAIFGLQIDEGYPSLLEAAQDLAALYASHPDFSELRNARAAAREAGEIPQTEDLVPLVGAFAGDGPAYIAQIREVLAS
ncbi:MAG: potassium/proton antiporter, partial [Pseudomonadota bacterium]